MKKLLATILLMTYFVVSTGFVVNMHYCMNRFDSVQLGAADSEKCNKCGMHTEDSDGCCRDEVKVLKLQLEPMTAKVLLPDFSVAPLELSVSPLSAQPFYNFTQLDAYFNLRPPLLSKQETYLSNCVFRI